MEAQTGRRVLFFVDAQSACELLRKVAALGLGAPATLVLENARYQKCLLVQQLADEAQGRTRFAADAAVPDVRKSSVTGRVEYTPGMAKQGGRRQAGRQMGR